MAPARGETIAVRKVHVHDMPRGSYYGGLDLQGLGDSVQVVGLVAVDRLDAKGHLTHYEATRYVQHDPGEIVSSIRAEEQDRSSDVLSCSEAPHRELL